MLTFIHRFCFLWAIASGRIRGVLSRSVYVVLAQYFEFIGLMDHLYELGLLDTGEYFVVGVCLADSDTITPDAYLTGNAAKNQSQESTAWLPYPSLTTYQNMHSSF